MKRNREELAPETSVTLPRTVTLEKVTPFDYDPHFIVRWNDGMTYDSKIFWPSQSVNEEETLIEAKDFARQIRAGFIPMRKVQQIDF